MRETGRNLLEQAELFHRRLRKRCAELKEQQDRKRVELLLDYLQNYEKRREKLVRRLRDQVDDRVLRRWFRYTPEQTPSQKIEEMDLRPDLPTQDVIAKTLELQKGLADWYEDMAFIADAPTAESAFREIAEWERKEGEELARNLAGMQDL